MIITKLGFRSFVAGFLFLVPAALHAETISLAGDWQAGLGARGEVKEFKKVKLPGSIAEQGLGEVNSKLDMGTWSAKILHEGPVVYQREIAIPAKAAGKRLTLFLERTKVTRVWAGDHDLGLNDSLINPHRYDLTGLAPGKQAIAIEVNNDRSLLPPEMTKGVLESHQISSQTQTNWNGIIGRIELQIDEPVSVSRVNVYPDLPHNELRVRLEIVNITGKPQKGTIVLKLTPQGKAKAFKTQSVPFEVTAGNSAADPGILATSIPLPAGDLAKWSEINPVLHNLTAKLTIPTEGISAEKTVRFGWRTFAADKTKFTINGQKTILRGETENAVFPLTGYSPMDHAYHAREMKTYRHFGLNHLRFHSWSPPGEMLAAADEAGIYMQPELPAWTQIRGNWLGTPESRAYYTREARDYLLENGNHPSFVMLSLGNELIVNTHKELMDKEKDRLYDFLDGLRKIDPTRLYTEQTGWSAPSTRNDYFCSFGLYNVGSIRSYYQQNTEFNLEEKVELNPSIPLIVAEAGQYNMFPDAGREAKKYTGAIDIRNIVEFNRQAKNKGLAPFIPDFERAGSAHAANLYAFESAYYLRTPGLGGYQILNLKDFPGQGTALCGMVDPFCDPKPGVNPDVYRQSCAPVTLLASLPKLIWTTDQMLTGKLLVANYGITALNHQKIQWRLVNKPDDKVLASGEFHPKLLAQGEVTSVGDFSIPLAKIAVPSQLALETEAVGLEVGGYAVKGSQNVWVYDPKPEQTIPQGVIVARSLTPAVVTALNEGKSVLMLPLIEEKILPRGISAHFRFGFWWGGDPMGTLIDDSHPLFKQFPTGFSNDLQWLNLMGLKTAPKSRGIILTGLLPEGQKPIVTMIPSYKRPELLGLIWEANISNGKMLVASMDIPGQLDKPEVRQMYSALLAYIGSPQFKPTAKLSLDQLKNLIRDENTKSTVASSDDPSIQYTGSWQMDIREKDKKELGRSSTEIGATVSWDFNGTGISVTARKDKMGSSYDVYLDGKQMDRAELYEDNTNGVIEVVWSKYDLLPGKHSIRLVLSEYRHPGSMGPRGWINKLESFAPVSAGCALTDDLPVLGPKPFIAYFKPIPVTGSLSNDIWGADAVGPRDPANGLEDTTMKQWNYWDGKVIRGKDGKYHMIASRWPQADGHKGWFESKAVEAVSDSLLGPYHDNGLCWPNDQGGKAHNVTALELPDGSYAAILSETRPCAVFTSALMKRPWNCLGKIEVNQEKFRSLRDPSDPRSLQGDPAPGNWHGSNVSLIRKPKGGYLMVQRSGQILLSKEDNILGPYEIMGDTIFRGLAGMPQTKFGCLEDPVIWFSGGWYHVLVNNWKERRAYHLISRDGIVGWKFQGIAYYPEADFIRYTNGVVNHWNKLERPGVVIEDGHVTALTFAVLDVPKEQQKGNDGHGSKIIVIPFDGEAMDRDLANIDKMQ